MAASPIPTVTMVKGVADFPDGVALKLGLADDGELTFAIKRDAVGPLFASITAQLAKSAPADDLNITGQTLVAIGAQAVFGPAGQPGIAIRMAGNWKLVLELTPEVLAGLRLVLAKLVQGTEPGSVAKH